MVESNYFFPKDIAEFSSPPWWLTTTFNISSRASRALFWPLRAPVCRWEHKYTQAHIYTHEVNKANRYTNRSVSKSTVLLLHTGVNESAHFCLLSACYSCTISMWASEAILGGKVTLHSWLLSEQRKTVVCSHPCCSRLHSTYSPHLSY